MIITSPGNIRYEVGLQIAETEIYKLFLCKMEGSKEEFLLQIALDTTKNGKLDYLSFTLKKLQEQSVRLENEYAKIKNNPNKLLNYSLCFPTLVESFTTPEQGMRRINILKFDGIEKINSLVPLYGMVHRDKLRVDVRTSVWIMGKLLKIIAFAHDAGIAVGDLSLGNILIEPNSHYVILFNWMQSQVISKELAIEEVKQGTLSIIKVLGGSLETGIPTDGSDIENAYANFLLEQAQFGNKSAFQAHAKFYEFVDTLWERGFYKFTTLRK